MLFHVKMTVKLPVDMDPAQAAQIKADEKATSDYGPTPGPFSHGDPNTRYRKQPAQDYGADDTMGGESKVKARQLRTGKPAQYNTK